MTHSRFALVTGSSRGIGRATALALAERGSNLALHYHTRKDAAEEVLAEVRVRGADGFTVPADVTQEDDLRRMVEQVRAEFGALDVLVSNARPELSAFYQPPLELTREAWRAAMDSQATAFLVAVQASATLLRDGGRIIALTALKLVVALPAVELVVVLVAGEPVSAVPAWLGRAHVRPEPGQIIDWRHDPSREHPEQGRGILQDVPEWPFPPRRYLPAPEAAKVATARPSHRAPPSAGVIRAL